MKMNVYQWQIEYYILSAQFLFELYQTNIIKQYSNIFQE